MRIIAFAGALVVLGSLLSKTAEAGAGVPLTDSSKGMACYYYAVNGLLSWTKPGGDWSDAVGSKNGDVAYEIKTISPSREPQIVEFDLTSLAKNWVMGTPYPGSIYLLGLASGRPGIVNFNSREHKDSTTHPRLNIEWDDGASSQFEPAADTYFACPTRKSLGGNSVFKVGGENAAALVFPFQVPSGKRVRRATLALVSDKQYGTASIGVFRLAPPANELSEVQLGIADKFKGDEDIESHPAVLFTERFERRNWRGAWTDIYPGGDAETVSADLHNSFIAISGKALRVRVKSGARLGLSMHQRFAKLLGGEPEEVYFRYYLRFGEDWDPVASGGKLPGLAGTYERAGWGGRKSDGTNGWSALGFFHQYLRSEPEFSGLRGIGSYLYHMDSGSEYGDPIGWNLGSTGMLQKNRWYSIEQYVKLNTPGAADGVLKGWIDGRLAYERTNLRYRSVPDLRIESVWMNVYHGGIAKAPADLTLYIDNVVIAREYIGPSGTR